MADKYSSDLCRIVIAQITQTIGYSCTLSAPLELLQDILQKFMHEFARDLHRHMEHANRYEPSVKDVRHSLNSLYINVPELLDYIGNVEPVVFSRDVPKFPIKRASNMNFLKPGSTETLMRPIHIFEYLPAMQETESSESIRESKKTESSQKQDDLEANTEITDKLYSFNHQKSQSPKPASWHFTPSNNNNKVDSDMNRSSMWELSSVVMTTGGFISPAIEGKLPEAFVPDIIEKYRGLDAPPITSLILQPLACSPKLEISSTTKIKAQVEQTEIDNGKQIFKAISTTKASDPSNLLLRHNNNNQTALKALSKKNKKQKDNFNHDKDDSKTEEKAQRRAMKLCQKLSKNQNDECHMLNIKKSKKTNSSYGNKAQQLEKLMKKQAKQRQNRLKCLTIKDKSLSYVETTGYVNTTVELNKEKQVTVESSTEMMSAVSANQTEIDQRSGIIWADIKKTCDPEIRKLDIFKKIKQKMVLPTNKAFGNPIIPGSPHIISLPSGTTITPTLTPTHLPLSGFNPETTMSTFNIMEPITSPEINSIDMLIKPKKRGRKPGGKNQTKQTNLPTSQSLNTFPTPHLTNLTKSATEQPLNLSNSTDQTVNSISKNVQIKDKKERKKGKLKDETSTLTMDNNTTEIKRNIIIYSSPETNTLTKINVVHDKVMTSSNANSVISNASLSSTHQEGKGMMAMPLLPLLHFPPQPGLIPTGPPPGIFPGVVTGMVGFSGGTNASKVGIPPFFPFSGQLDSIAVKNEDSDQLKLFRRTSSQSDLQTEPRNYCNVAPLIPPDGIKLGECENVACVATNLDNSYTQTQKEKATGNLGDPIEVSDDDSNETIDKRRKPFLMPRPEAPELFKNKTHLDLRNILPITALHGSGDHDKVKKFKSPVKLSSINSAPLSASPTSSISSTSPFPPRFQLTNFMGGGDKFSLAGGADLIPLSRVDCGSAYSSQKVPSNSLTAQNVNDDHQSFLPKFPTYEDITITPTGGTLSSTDFKQRKHHKKLKKMKEGKVKKKKDKKDKSKDVDLIFGGGLTNTSERSNKKVKALEKKLRKKKDKQQTTSIIHIPDDDEDNVLPLMNNIERGPASNLFVSATPATAISPKSTPTPFSTQIPKLTLKLSGKSTPLPLTNELMDKETPLQRERDHSPELARFSPLVTGPPKTKQSDSAHLSDITSTATGISPFLCNFSGSSAGNLIANSSVNTVQMPLVAVPTNARTIHQQMVSSSSGWMSISNNNTNTSATSTLSASSVLLPQQLMLMPTSKPINNFTLINTTGTAGRTTSSINPPETPSQILETKNHHRPSSYVDAEGNRIWICPACGKVDDGSAMIGCDGCDAWYHWICVGITIAPKDNDDWFCRVCITKKKIVCSDKKEKKQKKK